MADYKKLKSALERAFSEPKDRALAKSRLSRALDEAPQIQDHYSTRALTKALIDPETLLNISDPKDFERFAPMLGMTPRTPDVNLELGDLSQIGRLRSMLNDPNFEGFTDVPTLEIEPINDVELNVLGHDGRHRNRALRAEGESKTLWTLEGSPDWVDDLRGYPYHELLGRMLHDLSSMKYVHGEEGDRARFKKYFSPFRRGGLACLD